MENVLKPEEQDFKPDCGVLVQMLRQHRLQICARAIP